MASLAVTTLVLAQGKKVVRGKPKPKTPAAASSTREAKPEAPEEKPKAAEEEAPAAEAPVPAGSAALLPPESAKTYGDAGVRSSPLNPRADEFPDGGAVSTPAELDKILGDIATLRARVAAIGDTLFKSRIVVKIETRGDHAKIGKLALSLDEGIVYTAPGSFSADDELVVYDHAVAPGRHVLGVDVDRRDDRGETFRTGQNSRVTLEVPENQKLETIVRISDDSDMSDFPSGQRGSYDLRVRVRARASK
ncbi:MAG TPA: hypothetical protein VJT73_03805 [Polyangiaceae bacterium]|nr:hypothetical protein [Polyangiaceae bacterium]